MSPLQGLTGSVAPSVREGCRNSIAVIVAYIPFGLALGATIASAGVHPLLAWLTSPLLFGGAAQLLAVQLLGAGAGAAVVVLGALVVNARMLLYSVSLAPHASDWPGRWRWLAAYLLVDPVYALASARYGRPDRGGHPRERLAYYLAVGITFWVAWQVLTGAGVLLAAVLPASLHLELAAPLTFLLLLLPMLRNRAAYAAAAAGGGTALAASGLPLGLGLLLGAAVGIGVGALVGGRRA
ncbi:MAG TPA: AzlC family ABC transporter permease [Pseudonocardia sp.]|jgi:predicted branched-subunit amino acid permease